MIWQRSQRVVLIAIVLLLSGYLLIRLSINRDYVSDPPPVQGARAQDLAHRLDPNRATWQELAALPQIGPARAKELVAWRDQFVAAHPGQAPFARAEDLLRVKGIGASTLETLRPHLTFPTTRPAEETQDGEASMLGDATGDR